MGIVNKDGALWMATGIDNSGLYSGLNQAEKRIDEYYNTLNKVGGVVAGIFSVNKAADFLKQVVNVRSEFQNIEASFKVFLGDAEKAKGFIKEMQDYAFNNVFEFKDLTQQASQLLAFQHSYEDIIPIIDKLSNVAAGANVPLSQLVDLYNKAKSQGKLFTQDIQQWQRAGVPAIQELAKQFNVTEQAMWDMVTTGKVGFKEIDEVINKLTSDGGMFYGMMEEKMKTLGDSVGLLQDTITSVFNEIGEKTEDYLRSGILLANDLVENYEKVGKTLVSLIATYGTYRVALAIAIEIEKGYSITQLATYKRLLMVEKAQKLLNATMLKNPYVLVTTAVIGLATAMWALHDSTAATDKAQERFINRNQEIVDASEQRKNSAKELLNIIQDESQAETDRIKAYNDLIVLYPNLFKNIDIEKIKVAELTGLVKSLNEEEGKRYGAEKQSQLNNLYAQRNAIDERMKERNKKNNLSRSYDIKQLEEERKAISEQIELLEKEKQAFVDLKNQAIQPKEFVDISKEIEATRNNIKTLKDEIENLRSGKEKVEVGKSLKEAIDSKMKELKAQKDALEVLTGQDNSSKKSVLDANRLKSETSDRLRAIEEMRNRLLQQEKDGELELRQQRINLMEEGSSKTLEQINLDFDKREQAIMKRGEDLIKEQQEIERKVWEAENPDWKEKGMEFSPATVSIGQLSKISQQQLEDSLSIAGEEQKKKTEDLLKSTIAQYMDYAARRFEIEKKYNEDVAFLNSQRNKDNGQEIDASLQQAKRKLDESLSSLNLEELKDDIDWSIVFGNLEKVSTDALQSLLNRLKEYVSSIGDSLTPENMKEVMDAIRSMDREMAARNPFTGLSSSLDDYKKSAEGVSKAQKKLNELTNAGKKGSEEYVKVERSLTDAENKRRESLFQMNVAINEMGAKGGELVNAGQDVVDMLTSLGVKIPEELNNVLSGLGKVMSSLEKIDITKPFTAVTGSISVLSGIASTIGGLFGGGGKKVSQKVIDQYNSLISVLDKVIDKQNELLSAMSGPEAIKQSEKSLELIKKQEEAARNLFKETMDNRSRNAHSTGYRLGKTLDPYRKELEKLGFDTDKLINDRAKGLADLSAEELLKIMTELPELWAKIGDNERQYLEQIIETGEKTKELENITSEAITGISFDSLKNSLDDLVTSYDLAFEDIADSFEDHMGKAMLNMVKTQYLNEELKNWHEMLEERAKDGEISEQDRIDLEKYYEEIIRRNNEKYKEMMQNAGFDTSAKDNDSDNSLKGAYAKASQESIELLAGQTAAQRLAIEDIRSMMKQGDRGEIPYMKYFQDNLQVIRDLQANGWREVTVIKELSQQVANNTAELSRISQNIADSNEAISKNTENTVNSLRGTLDVKQKGGGLGL